MSLDPASPADPPDLSKVRTIDFRYQRPSALGQLLEAVADRLGDDPATWRTFMSFAESPNLTLDEVLDLVEATR
jgi:hypothetical protein